MQSMDTPLPNKLEEKIESLPRIPSSLQLLSDDNEEPEPMSIQHINESNMNRYGNLRVDPYPRTKSLTSSRKNPYSSTNSLLHKSKQRLARSNTARSGLRPKTRRTRPSTTRSHGNNRGPYRYEPPKYANWGMKIDSTEALRDEIMKLKKKCKSVSDENMKIKTEKRRMEKLLHRNDRKLKRLLNTVTDTKSLIQNPNIGDDKISKFLGDEHRKFAITEVLDMLNGEHNNNVSLKKKLQKTKDDLETAQSIIHHLEAQKQEIRSQHPLQPMQCEPDIDEKPTNQIDAEIDNQIGDEIGAEQMNQSESQQIIEHLEEQLEEYKQEMEECHKILESVTKSNEEAAQRLSQKDDCILKQRAEIKELRETVSNEKFFNNKILDEIAELKTTNKRLEEAVEEQKGIETQSKLQVKKLSNKLFDIEDELKEQIAFYQGFERQCMRYDQFIDTLCVQSQSAVQPDGVREFARNLKEWINRVQDEECDLEMTVQNAIRSLQTVFQSVAHCHSRQEQSVDEKLDDSTVLTLGSSRSPANDEESDMDQSELVHLLAETIPSTMPRDGIHGASSEMTSETFNGTNSQETTGTAPTPSNQIIDRSTDVTPQNGLLPIPIPAPPRPSPNDPMDMFGTPKEIRADLDNPTSEMIVNHQITPEQDHFPTQSESHSEPEHATTESTTETTPKMTPKLTRQRKQRDLLQVIQFQSPVKSNFEIIKRMKQARESEENEAELVLQDQCDQSSLMLDEETDFISVRSMSLYEAVVTIQAHQSRAQSEAI